jgi:non-ribosomal peptide synthetase component F
LTRELGALYGAFSAGEPSPLPELEIQFPAYAQWQRHFLASDEMERQLDYWRRQLAPPRAVLELPMQRRRGETARFLGASVAVSIPAATSDAVRTFAQREGGTVFMALLAAWSAVLSDTSGQEDVLIGTNVANRDGAELERVIGPFLNNVIVRTDHSGDLTFRELFARVRDTAFDAFAHQDVPFELLVEKLQPERQGTFAPLFQVMFVWQNFPRDIEGESAMEAVRAEFRDGTGVTNFDLFLMMSESPEGLVGTLTYDVDLFEGSVMERMARGFEKLVEQCMTDPDRRLSEVTAAPVSETRQILADFNEPLE